ncbi:MAG: SRPBCC family protein [Chloroflexota bacterium]
MPTTSVSRPIHATQQQVWDLLSDLEHAARWNKAWTRIDFTSTQHHGVGTTFRAAMEGTIQTFDFEVCDWSAPDRIAFCPIREADESYSIELEQHTFEVRALSDTESEVTITARASVHGIRGIVMGTFFWAGHQRQGLDYALDSIQEIFQPELFADRDEDPLLPDPALEPSSEE